MRHIGIEERRARLAIRHHLATPVADPVEAATGVVALHATDAASVYLSAIARMRAPALERIDAALYDDRALVRILGMRRTIFVLPVELAPIVQTACTDAIAARERRRFVELLTEAGLDTGPHPDAAAWLADVGESVVRALRARGEALSVELSADEPRLREQFVVAPGKNYEGKISVAGRLLPILAAEGRIIRGRPRGSWLSTQYRWAPVEAWLPPDAAATWDVASARAELVRRWLGRFGPGTAADLKWWTGLTLGEIKRALAVVRPVEVDLGGATGYVLAEDAEPVAAPEPWVALLPALDPTPMGWTERDWYLGEHRAMLFDRSGNIGPTVWCDGRVVGGWAQRADGEIAVRLLEDIGDRSKEVTAAAERLADLLGPARFAPKFRTPLERELIK
ncbi:MAG TPA: winged helix DNA-binding domain-containing protein [Streptosporangiaceae bacterium]|nr:winged helix DNA-binding domain-containing protein [Streptosporangiaceae bacterium]